VRDPAWVSVRYADIVDIGSPRSKEDQPVVDVRLANGEVRRLRIEARHGRVAAIRTFVRFLDRVVEDQRRE
jgi:hypothetical protein